MTSRFEDTAELKITKEGLETIDSEEKLRSPERFIRGSKGITWAFFIHKEAGQDVNVYLKVSEAGLYATGTIDITASETKEFSIQSIYHYQTANRIYQGCDLHNNDTVTVKVTFTNFEKCFNPGSMTVLNFITASPHYVKDARIQVDHKIIEVHRHFLCMISPVFQAEFTHDTKEAKTGVIKITDFTYTTVKYVIDCCYGCEYEGLMLSEIMNVLKFADKYDIKAVIEKYEPLFVDYWTVENFETIARYAWDFNRVEVKKKCAEFYREHHGNITLREDFRSLDSSVKLDIIDSAASIEPNK